MQEVPSSSSNKASTEKKTEEVKSTATASTENPQKKKRVKKFFKMFVNVRQWVSYDDISAGAKAVKSLYFNFFRINKNQAHTETYEEAVARLGKDEKQQVNIKMNFLYASLTYFVLDLCLFVYFIYLLLHMHFVAAAFDLMLVALVFLCFYRESFWYMQMKKKKLGCTFSDWIAFILWRDR